MEPFNYYCTVLYYFYARCFLLVLYFLVYPIIMSGNPVIIHIFWRSKHSIRNSKLNISSLTWLIMLKMIIRDFNDIFFNETFLPLAPVTCVCDDHLSKEYVNQVCDQSYPTCKLFVWFLCIVNLFCVLFFRRCQAQRSLLWFLIR